MAIQYDNKSKMFQVDYQSPFGGIDSTAYASAIDPKNFSDIQSGIVDEGYLTSIDWAQVLEATASGTTNFLGFVPVYSTSYLGYVILNDAVIVLSANGSGGINYTTISPYTPASVTSGYFSYVVIENQIIWTAESWHEIWSFNTNTNVITLLTNYVGGGYLGVLDNQLLNLGGVSYADGQVPYRISWSVPGEYGSFQPYDVGSNTGNIDAGFNDLPDTSDVLKGIITVGTVAYVFRSQGVTQMNITGNGVDPFQFNHLWASELGLGTVWADSIAQYGSMGAFVADSGIYTLGISGLTQITGAAKNFLMGQITAIANYAQTTFLAQSVVTAVCVPYLNNGASIYYVIGILSSVTVTGAVQSPAEYNIYAIDIENGNNCYSLGTQTIIIPSLTLGNYAVGSYGRLSFINTSYETAPVPAPPVPTAEASWAATTYYWPSGFIYALDTAGFEGQPVGTPRLYQINTSGSILGSSNFPAIITPPAAIGDTVTVGGTAKFVYKGSAVWASGATYNVGDYTAFFSAQSPGPGVYQAVSVYICTQAGISGSTQTGWTTTPGASQTDNTVIWSCIGLASIIFPTQITPGNSGYNVVTNTQIKDINSNFETIQPNWTDLNWTFTIIISHYSVNVTIPGGFSQTSAPTWSTTLGATTSETKTLSTIIQAATWVNGGTVPNPLTVLLTANAPKIVPLFYGVVNNINNLLTSYFFAVKTMWKNSTEAVFSFRKEQMKFGYVPTVTKTAFLAALIDTTVNGTISISVDGGLTYNTAFADVTITAGVGNPGNGIIDNVYGDGVQSLERPQLSIKTINVKVAEVWYQGTLADYELI
jgi:hypothetical protein